MSLRTRILDVARAIATRKPRPVYRTVNRFGPDGYDCSGYTYVCYRDGAGIRIGADTGAIARDVAAGRARFIPRGGALPGDLVMRRSGSIYNGGPDEHVGIVDYYAGSTLWTWESASSQEGVGHYARSTAWWTDAVRYHQLDDQTAPSDPHQEPDMLQDEREALFLTRADAQSAKDTAIKAVQKVDGLRGEVLPLAQTARAEAEAAKNYAKRASDRADVLEAKLNELLAR